MKLEYMIACFLLLLTATGIAAERKSFDPYDDIFLKDGTVYHGYISEQNMTGNIKIHYVSVTRSIEGAKVQVSDGSLVSVIMDGQEFRNVSILEEGDRVTFRQDIEKDLSTHISQIEKTVRPVIEGIIDIIKTKNYDEYRGHIVETVPGKYLKLQCENGSTVVILQKNISQQQRTVKDKSQSIVSQSPFWDKYKLKEGNMITGVLDSQLGNTLGVVDTSDNHISFNLKDVQVIYKEYHPEYTIISPPLSGKDIRLNGKEYSGIPAMIEPKSHAIRVDSSNHLPYVFIDSETIDVEFNSDLILDPSVLPYKLYKYNPYFDENGYLVLAVLRQKGKTAVPHIVPDSSEKRGHVFGVRFDDLEKGFYVLLSMSLNNMFLIVVN